jgi:hypothetical protein
MKMGKMMSDMYYWFIGLFIGFWIGTLIQENSDRHHITKDCSFTGSHAVDNYIITCNVKEVTNAKETKTSE